MKTNKFTAFEPFVAEHVEQVSAKKRAAMLGCKIQEAIKAGEFELLGMEYLTRAGKLCQGCAISAAAYVCGLQPAKDASPKWNRGGDACQVAVVEHGLMTPQEAAQLEMGFENFCNNDTWTGEMFEADPESPFYQLGKKMGLSVGNRTDGDILV